VRILHVIHRYPPAIGGSETWCAGIARWQAAHGHRVTVLTLRAVEEDELWEEKRDPAPTAVGVADCDAGVHVRRCAVGFSGPALRKLLAERGLWHWTGAVSAELCGRLARLARSSDVVHSHNLPAPHNYLAWLAARLARRPFILTPHFHAGDRAHEQAAVRWLVRRADRVVVLTDSEARALASRGVPSHRLIVVNNAVDTRPDADPLGRAPTRSVLGVPPDAPLLFFLGRKAAYKGIEVLFRALRLIRHRPSPVLALAGPTTDWYRSLPAATGPVRVIDLPVLPEAAKTRLLAAADLLVLPSRHEAFGTVFLEAWAAGTAVIGADIPATREAIGDAGTLFRVDDPVDLAARIDAALADPAEARRQVARGRERIAAAHTWDHVGPAVDASYRAAERRGSRVGSRVVGSDALPV
jgi:glycosyltransferase involved in cell wall biosynthesis